MGYFDMDYWEVTKMIIGYLLIVLVNGVPQPTGYATDAEACVVYSQNSGSYLYEVSGKKSDPVFTKGTCPPVQHFVPQK
jgi:hypothetical protein